MTSKRDAALAILMVTLFGVFTHTSQEITKENQQALHQRDAAIQKLQQTVETQNELIHTQNETIQSEEKSIQKMNQTLATRESGIVLNGFHPTPWEHFTATWYSYQGGWETGTITRTGAQVHEGTTVAVDPSVIPLNSIIEVKFRNGTTHEYKATDTGGAIVGAHIDIFDTSQYECVQNGRQAVFVRILTKG